MRQSQQKIETGEVIDLTPTWTALLPALIAVLENGNRSEALKHLRQMAKVADMVNPLPKVLVHIEDGVIQNVQSNSDLVQVLIMEIDDNGDEPVILHDYDHLHAMKEPFHTLFDANFTPLHIEAIAKLKEINC